MSKFEQKFLARELRNKGKSIKEISKAIGVSKSTVSLWCNDIFISKIKPKINKGYIIANENRKKERINRVNIYKSIGIKKIGEMSSRELFLIGTALYWAEGDKKQRRVLFINSDPNMILVFIKWLEVCLNIPKDRLICRVEINKIHKDRINIIQCYWSDLIKISSSQFRTPSFKKSKIKKIYQDNSKYYGSLQITVSKGTNLSYEILGYIQGVIRFTSHDKIWN